MKSPPGPLALQHGQGALQLGDGGLLARGAQALAQLSRGLHLGRQQGLRQGPFLEPGTHQPAPQVQRRDLHPPAQGVGPEAAQLAPGLALAHLDGQGDEAVGLSSTGSRLPPSPRQNLSAVARSAAVPRASRAST
jgi:hypothetical protein